MSDRAASPDVSHPRALALPPGASGEPDAFELVRVWAAGGRQHVALRVSPQQDPAGWGFILADLGRHVAQAYADAGAGSAGDAFERLLEGFAADVGGPASPDAHDG